MKHRVLDLVENPVFVDDGHSYTFRRTLRPYAVYFCERFARLCWQQKAVFFLLRRTLTDTGETADSVLPNPVSTTLINVGNVARQQMDSGRMSYRAMCRDTPWTLIGAVIRYSTSPQGMENSAASR